MSTKSLLESYMHNLDESIELPTEVQTFATGEVGKNYNAAENACKLNAVKAHIEDNAEDIYAGSVKADGNEITHFFNVKDGKVIDHSGTAQKHEMSDYKGVPIASVLEAKGYSINPSKLQFCQFQNENGDIVECGNLGNKLFFTLNGKSINYDDLINLKEENKDE